MKAFLVISRYKEDISWVKNLTSRYVIYNKGDVLPEEYVQIERPNFGANQYDIFHFIHSNYDNLPELMAFTQGDPFDHCLSERFYSLISSNTFTPLFGDRNYPHGNYSEDNNNWYLNQPWQSHKPQSKFSTFDEYMEFLFCDYVHEPVLTFPPGSQIIVERERCLFYSRDFWEKLMSVFPTIDGVNGGREAHIVERSIQLIFENKYHEKLYDGSN